MKYNEFTKEMIKKGKKFVKKATDEQLQEIDDEYFSVCDYLEKFHMVEIDKRKLNSFYYFMVGLLTTEGFDERYHLWLINQFTKR